MHRLELEIVLVYCTGALVLRQIFPDLQFEQTRNRNQPRIVDSTIFSAFESQAALL